MYWTRFVCLCLLGCTLFGCSAVPKATLPEHVPAGYTLVYQQDFSSSDAVSDFVYTDKDAWRRSEGDTGDGYLELFGKSDYQPEHRSPRNIALIRTATVGSFVLDVDMQQSGREYGHRDLCVFFGFNDPNHFYYSHMATKGDRNAHQVFIVNQQPRTPITTDRTKGVNWGNEVWRRIRVVRDADAGTIAVYLDDMEKPIQVAKDTTFAEGYVGFGSFDDVGKIDNIRLYAPSMTDEPCKYFDTVSK